MKQTINRCWRLWNREIFGRTGMSGQADDTEFFCLTLVSDAIILDDYLRHQSFIRPEDLVESAQVPGGAEAMWQYELFHCFTAMHRVAGWNVVPEARLPSEDDLAIEKGAVFVYRRKKDVAAGKIEANAILDLLSAIELNGVGLRRNEGFGRAVICDEFHCLREAI